MVVKLLECFNTSGLISLSSNFAPQFTKISKGTLYKMLQVVAKVFLPQDNYLALLSFSQMQFSHLIQHNEKK